MSGESNSTCDDCKNPIPDCVCLNNHVLEPDTESDTDADRDSNQDSTLRVQLGVDAAIASVIDAKFRIIGELGSGADSTVYLAEHLYLQKKVSLKLFKPIDFESNRFARIQREAVTLASIDHPNIVGVTDLGLMDNGTPYIVQEYIEGRDFSALIKDKGPLSEERALKLFCEIASGVAFLHDKGIIHRDIKPSNIIISPGASGEESAKLIDLGIAKPDNPGGALSFCTTSGSIFGSPFYMSPEQCKGAEINPATDIYSFGCVMYEALTGFPPFRGQTMLVTLEKHISEQAPPVNSRRHAKFQVSTELEAIVHKCLEKNPGNRFRDVKQLHRRLMKLKQKRKLTPRRLVAAIAACLAVFLMCAFYIVRTQQLMHNEASLKKRFDATKIIDKHSCATILESLGSREASRFYEEAVDEALRQKVPALTMVQIGSDAFRYQYDHDDAIGERRIFSKLKRAIDEIDEKFAREPTSFQGRSLECMHRVYYYAAATESMRKEKKYKFIAQARLEKALSYAEYCNRERVDVTYAPALIRSRLAKVYLDTNKPELAEKMLQESIAGLQPAQKMQAVVLINDYLLLTRTKLSLKKRAEAQSYLDKAVQLRNQSRVTTYDQRIEFYRQNLANPNFTGDAE